jgi:hypothetical protein
MKFQGAILFCLWMVQVSGQLFTQEKYKDFWTLAASTYCPIEQFCLKCTFFFKENTYVLQETTNRVGTLKVVIAINDADSEITVAFKGTDFQNFDTDSNIIKVGNLFYGKVSPTMKVHRGFYNAFKELEGTGNFISSSIKENANFNPLYNIVFTGHSLGGALALLQAVKYNLYSPSHSNRIDVVTFGQPRVGDLDFTKYVNSLPFAATRIRRIVNYRDEIPRLPLWSMRFYHTKNQYNLYGTELTLCTIDETKENPSKCMKGIGSPLTPHSNYFQTPNTC